MRASLLAFCWLLSLPMAGIDTHRAAHGNLLRKRAAKAGELFAAGEYLKAAAIYEQAARDAGEIQKPAQRLRYLANYASCQFALRQLRSAFGAYLEARTTAERM